MPSSSRTEHNSMDDSASGSAGSVAIEIERLTGGEVVELAANRTMVLDDPDTALVVEEGNVLVFAVELVDSKPLGKRHLLCTLEPGDGAFGVSIESRSAMGLLATGIGSSRVRRISIGDLRAQLAGGPRSTDHSGDAVAYCVESWIELLTLRISTGRLPGGLQSTLSAGIEELESDQAECPPEGVMWAEARQGSILASGCEESITSPGDPLLPISENGWISSIDSAQVMMIASGDALGTDAGWAGLKRFTAVAVDVMARTALSDVNRRKIAARRSAIRDAQLTERAINDLAEVLPSRHREIHRAVENPLDEALKSVEDQLGVSMAQEQEIAGEAMGSATDSPQNLDIDVAGDVVEFDERNTDTEQDGKPTAQGPVRTRKDDERAELVAYSDLLNKLRRMAGRTGCRARRASLDPWWWESDNGPLIGFVAADWRPVALLRGHGGYEAYDPTLGTRVKVDRAYAETLRYEAVAFSRGLAAELHRATTLLLHAVKGSGVDLVKVLIFGSLAGLASLVVPLATGLIFNTIVPNSERHRLLVLTLVLIMVALGVAAGSMARGVAFIRARARTTASAQMSVWDRLLRLPASFFSEYAVGELLSRTQSIQLSQQIMSDAIVANLLNGVFGIFNLILLLKGGGTLFLLGIVLLAIQFFVTVWINLVASTPAILKQLSAQNSTQSLTLQIVRGMNKLRVAAAESRAFSVWAHRFSAQQRATYRQGKLKAINGVFTLIWPTLASLAIVGGVLMTGRAHIDLGNYVAYTTAFTQASTALITIGVGFGVLSTSLSYLEQLHPLLQAVPEVGTGQTDPGVLEGKVAVSQVMFRYSEDRPLVLKGVTIRANPGEFIALVGPSGAGKSSIMRLLLGFDRPEAGVIAYDDRDLGLLDTTAVRRQIGSVIQGAQLLPGTIFTNIAGGLPITRDEAWDAARAAGMDEDIADMPMGMETVVQEGGGTLSGGQRQRLLIARSLALKPKILFFDEATSALDNITQAQVTDSINKLQVTRVVIAHRLSTIKDADKIYVLVAGEVAQSGTYEELIAVEGPFRDLATRQIT